MEPFLDLVRLLRPRAALWGGINGTGRWAVAFRPRQEVLFCWMEAGECRLLRPGQTPVVLRPHDFVLIHSATPFVLGTARKTDPIDSEASAAATRRTKLKVGEGTRCPVTLKGGRFVFQPENEVLLLGMVPPLMHLSAADTSSWRVRSLLQMAEEESRRPGPGGEWIVKRLVELILVEVLRGAQGPVDQTRPGLLAGLGDPITRRALAALHANVAHDWTVAELAKLCGVSRSGFAARFRALVGSGPSGYLQRWRIAVAKAELRRGTKSVGEIAQTVGFQSVSAFSAAFTRRVGCSPRRFAASLQNSGPRWAKE